MPKVSSFTSVPELPLLETQVMERWQQDGTFQKSVAQRPETQSYVFYDGPPFATGMPHYGHLLASTTKDVIPRYWTMKGYRVERVWGWDCHGLPIEHMIEKQLDIKGGKKGIEELGIDRFNQACRSEVLRLDGEWEKIINRLGRWVDMKHNYKTMDQSFMESVWWGFQQLAEKGMVYEGRKVILYCPRCSTPLSNFEIAMDNSYQDVTEPSTTYKYPVVGQADTFLLAWSTTPWNKLATPALAVNPTLKYVKVQQGAEQYWLAETALERVLDTTQPYQVTASATGQELTQLTFTPHFDFYASQRTATEKIGVVVADEFVTADEGTGVVTLAVYGEDDYRVMQREGVQLVEHVDEEGRLKPEVTPWAGLSILDVNPLVDAELSQRGLVYRHQDHQHSVATCYRCSTRLYYAPLPAWFIDVQQIKKQLVQLNEKINWYPEHLKHGRFLKGLENAPDWNISRSRYWGTPMPVWVAESGQRRIIGSIEELRRWAVNPDQLGDLADIHREHLDEVEVWVDDAKTQPGRRISEVFDCWVESGSMPFASLHYPFENKTQFEATYPAQFVSEYIAQTRAWFYTMHVLSVGIFGQPPFENVLTTGTILAEDGSKMSKSKKNYPDPMVLIDTYGVDSLRLYLMSSTVMKGENLNFSEKEVADIRRKVMVVWWNLISFYHSFADLDTDLTRHPESQPHHIMDQWLLSSINHLTQQVTDDMDHYDVVRASRRLMEFVSELSTWYLRLSRDRLRLPSQPSADQRQAHQETSQVFGHTLYRLAQLMAPFTPFFSEVWYHSLVTDEGSIHLTDWPTVVASALQPKLEQEMTEAKRIVEQARAARQAAGLKLRQPLAQATVTSSLKQPSEQLIQVLVIECNVKHLNWESGNELQVLLDTKLTPELLAEGQAREAVRQIQDLRKKAGLKPGDPAKVTLPEWPADWQSWIMSKTNVVKLEVGEAGVKAI